LIIGIGDDMHFYPPADKQVGTHRGQALASMSIIQSRRCEAPDPRQKSKLAHTEGKLKSK